MKNIEWLQVLVAFALGVALAALVRSLIDTVRSRAQGALG